MQCRSRYARWLIIVCLLFPVRSWADEVPAAAGRVNDFAGVLIPAYRQKISKVIDELENKTSAEIRILQLIIPFRNYSEAFCILAFASSTDVSVTGVIISL